MRMGYTVVTYMLDGQKRATRVPRLGAKAAQESLQAHFPKAEILTAVEHGLIYAPETTHDGEIPTAAETRPLAGVTQDHMPAPHVETPVPERAESAPVPAAAGMGEGTRRAATARLGRTSIPPEIQRDSARDAPAPAVKEREREIARRQAALRHSPPPQTGTHDSDAAVGLSGPYPQIGDSVQIDVDTIPRMQRQDIHQRLIDAGLHGKHGVVQGTEVRGGIYMLRVETGTASAWVDARCVRRESPPPQPQMMQDESRQSPEKMRKPGPGAYNLT